MGDLDKMFCGQCGEAFAKPACGPTHASIAAAEGDLLGEAVALLREGEDIISGLEAACDEAGVGDMSEVRAWWSEAQALLARVDGKGGE